MVINKLISQCNDGRASLLQSTDDNIPAHPPGDQEEHEDQQAIELQPANDNQLPPQCEGTLDHSLLLLQPTNDNLLDPSPEILDQEQDEDLLAQKQDENNPQKEEGQDQDLLPPSLPLEDLSLQNVGGEFDPPQPTLGTQQQDPVVTEPQTIVGDETPEEHPLFEVLPLWQPTADDYPLRQEDPIVSEEPEAITDDHPMELESEELIDQELLSPQPTTANSQLQSEDHESFQPAEEKEIKYDEYSLQELVCLSNL